MTSFLEKVVVSLALKAIPSDGLKLELEKFLRGDGPTVIETLALLKEWDDRTGAARRRLYVANPRWLTPAEFRSAMAFDYDAPTSRYAQAAADANVVLTFMDDVALAINKRLVDESIAGEPRSSFTNWWARCQPLRDCISARGSKDTVGWDHAK